jgi:hypothetical protein
MKKKMMTTITMVSNSKTMAWTTSTETSGSLNVREHLNKLAKITI